MLQRGDGLVYVLLLGLTVFWLWRMWKKNRAPSAAKAPTSGKTVKLLEREGYELVSGKMKLPLTLFIGERETTSALTSDYLVKQNGRTYVVKTEREEGETLSARRVREQYLALCLAFKAAGVIIINADKTRVKHVDITLPAASGSSRLKWALTSFLLGAGVTFFWLY